MSGSGLFHVLFILLLKLALAECIMLFCSLYFPCNVYLCVFVHIVWVYVWHRKPGLSFCTFLWFCESGSWIFHMSLKSQVLFLFPCLLVCLVFFINNQSYQSFHLLWSLCFGLFLPQAMLACILLSCCFSSCSTPVSNLVDSLGPFSTDFNRPWMGCASPLTSFLCLFP